MPRCLILEDDEMFREILERLARGVGLETTVVSTSHQAIAAVTLRDFDVLLFDLRLNGNDDSGLVLDYIRGSKPHLLPRVLCVTGSTEMIRKVAFDVPCVDKGNLETLGEKLRSLL